MRGYMFRTKWGALLFAVATAAGAATLIGGEQDRGVLLNAAEDIQQQKAAMEATMSSGSSPLAIPTSARVEFTSEEELIDDASGFDPTPVEDGAPLESEVVPHDEVVIVSRDVGDAGQ